MGVKVGFWISERGIQGNYHFGVMTRREQEKKLTPHMMNKKVSENIRMECGMAREKKRV